MAKRAKKEKKAKVDGLGPDELKRIHSAVRLVWSRCHARRLAVKRATGKDGFVRCELCNKRTPRVHVDHIEPVGKVGGPQYIERMFKPSHCYQVLCPKCHGAKTRADKRNGVGLGKPKKAKKFTDEF